MNYSGKFIEKVEWDKLSISDLKTVVDYTRKMIKEADDEIEVYQQTNKNGYHWQTEEIIQEADESREIGIKKAQEQFDFWFNINDKARKLLDEKIMSLPI